MPELDPTLMQSLLSTFRAEAIEHVETLNQSLLSMERTVNDAECKTQLQTAFRAAHSLKGAARAVSIHDIEHIAHAMETVLQQARDGALEMTVDICDLLYDSLDGIQGVLDERLVDADTIIGRLHAVSPNGKTPAGDAPDADPAENPEPDEPIKAPLASNDTIRVAVDKLDELMAQVGELLVARISTEQRLTDIRNMRYQVGNWSKTWREIKAILPRLDNDAGKQLAEVLHRHADDMHAFTQAFGDLDQATNHDSLRLNMVTDTLQEKVRRVRMIPFSTISLALERVVRDAARSEDKLIDFEIRGQEIELDKKVLELLKDPLIHLLRNAVGHGIEPKATRIERGKPETGKVHLKISQRGSEVHLHIIDDGNGFDMDKLRQAYQSNYHDTDEGDESVSIAFMPGVSTADSVTELAGRGVGLDVVRSQIETMQGRINVDNRPGDGVTIELIVPTSMAMTRGLLVSAAQEQYVLPLLAVEKIIEAAEFIVVSGKQMIRVDDQPIPVVPLSQLLERPTPPVDARSRHLAVIMAVADQRLALLVDDAITEQELAVKPLGSPLKRVRNVTGAALLGTGEPVVVLNPADLVRSARGVHVALAPITEETEDTGHRSSILVVDDSITTRTLEKNILEAAGYQVITATDGREGIRKLQEAEVDIVVSDIEMPNMNGFELTRALRDDPATGDLPIILVTSLESREHREKGLRAGANAYIVKRGFDQAELLATIDQLL